MLSQTISVHGSFERIIGFDNRGNGERSGDFVIRKTPSFRRGLRCEPFCFKSHRSLVPIETLKALQNKMGRSMQAWPQGLSTRVGVRAHTLICAGHLAESRVDRRTDMRTASSYRCVVAFSHQPNDLARTSLSPTPPTPHHIRCL